MKQLSFDEILGRLAELDNWLKKLELQPKKDRLHHAIELVRNTEKKRRECIETGQPLPPDNYSDFHFALIEVLEWGSILEAFRSEPSDKLGPIIKRALKGSTNLTEEKPDNAVGRNTQFELALAAEWRLFGLKVDIGEPDCTLTLGGTPFLTECKRPFRDSSIADNVQDAASQLGAKLNKHSDSVGIIAISVSRIVNPGTQLFWTPDSEGFGRFGERAGELMRANEKSWKPGKLNERIVAVLFHTLSPGVIKDTGLCLMKWLDMTAVTENHEFELLKGALVPFYQNP